MDTFCTDNWICCVVDGWMDGWMDEVVLSNNSNRQLISEQVNVENINQHCFHVVTIAILFRVIMVSYALSKCAYNSI